MFLCYLTGHKYLALRKSRLCWLHLAMLCLNLVTAACGQALTLHPSRRWAREQGEGWGAVTSLSTRAGQWGHQRPSRAGTPFPKATIAPGTNGDPAADWLPSRLVPAAALVSSKGQPCQTPALCRLPHAHPAPLGNGSLWGWGRAALLAVTWGFSRLQVFAAPPAARRDGQCLLEAIGQLPCLRWSSGAKQFPSAPTCLAARHRGDARQTHPMWMHFRPNVSPVWECLGTSSDGWWWWLPWATSGSYGEMSPSCQRRKKP